MSKAEPTTVGELLDANPIVQEVANAPLATIEPPKPPALVEQPDTLLAAIIGASRDPAIDVTKLKALMDMQERLEDRQAKRDYITAFARLSAKLPQVEKNGTIDLGKGKPIPFAKWEDMDAVVRPMMADEGLTISFRTARQSDGLDVIGILMHVGGHSEEATMPLPFDSGPGRNNLQARGSTLSYGKRYCAEMLLNIVRKGVDNDAKTADDMGLISDEQKAVLVGLMREVAPLLKDPAKMQARFHARFKVETLDDLPASAFLEARGALRETINANKKPSAP